MEFYKNKIVAGQSVPLADPFLRIGFFVKNLSGQEITLFVTPVFKKNKNQSSQQIVYEKNKKTDCGKLILFGTPGYWLYEIDLRCLKNQYRRIVFAVVCHASPEQNKDAAHIEITANIEQKGCFFVEKSLNPLKILRVFDLYNYHGLYKLKAYEDVFSIENFSNFYSTPSFQENIATLASSSPSGDDLIEEKEDFKSAAKNTRVSYDVFLFGSCGSGKNSIIAAMNDQLSKISAIANIELFSSNSGFFSEFLFKALNVYQSDKVFDPVKIKNQMDFLLPNQGHCEYKTFLAEENSKFRYSFNFYRALVNPDDDSFSNDENFALLKSSQVVIFPVDSVALIEQNGRWNQLINKPRELTDFCKRAFVNNKKPKLVLFVPIKCEFYAEKGRSKELLFAIEESYAGFFNFISHINSISCAVVPVQTLGHVAFHRIIETQDYPDFLFKKYDENSLYSPKDADQLWTYILTFLLSQTLRLNRMKSLPVPLKPIHKSMNALLSHRKQGAEGFKIFQGFREMS